MGIIIGILTLGILYFLNSKLNVNSIQGAFKKNGANPEDKNNKEYIVHTNYDGGSMKTRTLAKSAEEARDLVHKSEQGSLKSAHKVLVKDNPERTAEEVKKIFDNGKRKIHAGVVSKNKKGDFEALY